MISETTRELRKDPDESVIIVEDKIKVYIK